MEPETVREEIRTRGLEIFRLMGTDRPAVFDRGRWTGRLMERMMRDPEVKVPLFRFVDVLPALAGSGQVAGHAREYFPDGKSPLPRFAKFLLSAARSRTAAALTARLFRWGVGRFAKTFIAGEDPESAMRALRRLWNEGKTFTVDILGEAVVS